MSEQLTVPSSAQVYKAGSVYKSLLLNGIAFRHDTDAVSVINAAIAATSTLPAPPKITLLSNIYTCLSEITVTGSVAGKHGVRLVGESSGNASTAHGCKLDFAPAGALTNAIRFQMHDSGLEDIWVKANANVTNIIRVDGNGQKGLINRCSIEGASSTPTAGQIGILNDAATASATYYWKVTNSQIGNLDVCMRHDDNPNPSNKWFHTNLNFINCNGGIDCNSTLHTFSQVFMQAGVSLGDYCIKLGSGAAGCTGRQIGADLMGKAGSGVVVLDSGALLNDFDGVYNSGSRPEIIDNSGQKNRLRTAKYANLATQAPGASPYTYTNTSGSLQEVTVGGGTVTEILFIRTPDTGGVNTGLTSGVFSLESNDALKITYSLAPTMLRIGH